MNEPIEPSRASRALFRSLPRAEPSIDMFNSFIKQALKNVQALLQT